MSFEANVQRDARMIPSLLNILTQTLLCLSLFIGAVPALFAAGAETVPAQGDGGSETLREPLTTMGRVDGWRPFAHPRVVDGRMPRGRGESVVQKTQAAPLLDGHRLHNGLTAPLLI